MKRWLVGLALAAWFAISLQLRSADLRDSVLHSGHHPSALLAVLMALPAALLAMSVVLGPIWLMGRYPITRTRVVVGVARHVLLACAIAFSINAERDAISIWFATRSEGLASNEHGQTFAGVVGFYVLCMALAHAVEYARQYQQKQTAELRLQAELGQAELERASAELRMLKMQLNPHFLFNSLNAISLLISSAPAAAQRMVVGLADLLRRAMHSVATQEVALEEELAGLAPFVEIEKLRLGGKLTVEWQIAADVRDALVPHMILQPLVENAIKHGIVPAGGGGVLRVQARREGNWLVLAVRDDGAGLASGASSTSGSRGIGSANVRARLTQLYGERHSFELRPADGRGTLALLRLPWHDDAIQPPASSRAMHGVNDDRLDTTSLVSPPSRGLLLTELMVSGLVLVQQWSHGYALRYKEAIAHGSAAPGTLAVVFSGIHAIAMAGGLLATFRLCRTRPFARTGLRRTLPSHALLATAFFVALYGERVLGNMAIGYTSRELKPQASVQGIGLIIMYVLVASLAHAVEYVRRYQWKHAAELRLQVELGQAELSRTTAELRMLKMQLNPHFLFNSLNALSLLILTAPTAAQRMVVGLADLSRRAMHSVATQEVTLDEELAGLAPFIEIEKIRLGDGLRIVWEIAEDTRDALVPHMILQPLVENAIKHGIVPAGGQGVLRIGAAQSGEWLELTVADDGAGLAAEAEPATLTPNSNGVGAANVRARLGQLYGTRYTLELRPAEGGGTLVVMRLPWK